ncbi:MAG: hypothetical protein KC443_09415 [Anaerolineales bacterium]|nr:hypothetical protein [Anaerolineales bacterium]
MNGNLLLLYLSELGNGRWTQFTDALKTLSAPWKPSTHARHLQMLAHIEVDFASEPKRWSIAPPTLAWLPRYDNDHHAVLCGWRTEPLLKKLHQSIANLECHLEIMPQENCPDAIVIHAKESYQLDTIADQLSIQSEPESAARLAQCLPHLDDYLSLCPSKHEPHGYGIRQFEHINKQWEVIEHTSKTGLFEYDCVDGRQYRLKTEDNCRELRRDEGLYALMDFHELSVLRYEGQIRALIVPSYAPLPILFARSAILCSGKLPLYDFANKQRQYQDVSTAVAYNILTKLKQETLFT